MKRKDNFKEVQDLRETLTRLGKMRYESFVMPESTDEFGGGEEEIDIETTPEQPQETQMEQPMYDDEVRSAIVQIRKISIGIIAKLADNPTSESYTFMKRVLDMSDKAMESMNKGGEEVK